MAFQSSILSQIGFGIPGEMAFEGPLRAQPAILVSTDATFNVFGRAFTWVSGATGSPIPATPTTDPKPFIARAGAASATTSRFAGLLVNPKEHVLLGSLSGGSFGPSLILPNNTQASLAEEGDFVVALPAGSSVGDSVFFLIADGTLVTSAQGAALPAGAFDKPIGVVTRYVNAGASLAVVRLIPFTFPHS